MDKFTGDSRGFGFVEMPNKTEADAAISGLNGKDLKGRTRTRAGIPKILLLRPMVIPLFLDNP